ncbi:MAG: 4-(cytidine 5'-diphospho)-2-C-methyl-D-erythritol kinase, partial [Clostridium sp.]|nr:4-(cytidine 5'-diphospho)-2-C-methyl-D-erythritol kinase [Clostridium sp.]
MKGKAHAKINISLDVVGKREDGYHLLSMIMQSIELYDEIEISEIREGITINCNKSFIPTDERNLAYKAARLFLDTYKIKSGVLINIIKNIPVAAGLAGGSADCAAVLRILNKMFNVNASDEELMKLGEKLGADVPYCIKGGTAL